MEEQAILRSVSPPWSKGTSRCSENDKDRLPYVIPVITQKPHFLSCTFVPRRVRFIGSTAAGGRLLFLRSVPHPGTSGSEPGSTSGGESWDPRPHAALRRRWKERPEIAAQKISPVQSRFRSGRADGTRQFVRYCWSSNCSSVFTFGCYGYERSMTIWDGCPVVMFRVKKYLQLVLLVSLFLATGVFLLHQKSYRSFGAVDSSHAQEDSNTSIYSVDMEVKNIHEVGWQERAPRSLSGNDYENNFVEVLRSTATPSPSSTSVADLFISVKTTVHYHQARLPVILKTWFQLAKQQTPAVVPRELAFPALFGITAVPSPRPL
ncbi:unnamed protein product [Nesidiocoris tenuis]|uniref:Fringe-like glycosyltransferase domain-containing protein n=1 Tax=Nesidiocoris tenuis TaxID=355587 RepID=A0A6H5GIN1_9HEMI|nr:unnamed protein product [Nesidiocoris tenuis]